MIASLVLTFFWLVAQDTAPDEETFERDQALHNPRVAIVGDHLITFRDIASLQPEQLAHRAIAARSEQRWSSTRSVSRKRLICWACGTPGCGNPIAQLRVRAERARRCVADVPLQPVRAHG